MQAAITSAGRQGKRHKAAVSPYLHRAMCLETAPMIKRCSEYESIGKTAADIVIGVTAQPSLARWQDDSCVATQGYLRLFWK
jgi:hypothetical protein